MRRRSRAGGEPAKTRRPKASAPKRRNVAKAKHPRSSLVTRQETKVALLARERDEASEQLSAASEIFKVISSSPGDLKPVFDAILKNATRICAARFGTLWLAEGDGLRAVAVYNAPPGFAEVRRGTLARPNPKTAVGRVLTSKLPVQVVDLAADAAYAEGDPLRVALVEVAGMRTLLAVPMLKETELVGTINIYRQEVRPFTDKQIVLVQNFAAQAVIAIENTRLLSELRQRTHDLTESLEQQTATSEVLQVISSSSGQLKPVFDSMLDNAIRICEAKFGILFRFDQGVLRPAAMLGVSTAFAELLQRGHRPEPGSGLYRALQTGQVIHFGDIREEQGYRDGIPLMVAGADIGGIRSLINVPMLSDTKPVGAIGIFRTEVRPFTVKQIALVQNFAAQAVIAIENTRLLNELRESLQQQTATADVLKVISSSPGDLEPVFQAMLENATRICEAKFGTMYFRESDGFRAVAMHGAPPAYVESRLHKLVHPGPATGIGRVLQTKQAVQIEDASTDQGYTERDPLRVSAVELGGVRTLLDVPMLKENEVIGAVAIYREVVRPFTDKQVALVQNFANQAVIAIENTRLLNELRQRTTDLSESLEDLRTAQDRLVQTEKLASLGQLTAGIAHEIKNPLNFVNNFSSVSVELIDELRETLGGVKADDKTRTEINELTDTLRGNLEKVVQHGKRADSIVKNMLLHSRQGSGEHRPVDINDLVEESLNLAYHGARAEKEGFNITLEKSFDPTAGEADLFPQEITRVLLNLISNGFYAATKRDAGANYEPTVTATTKSLGDSVEIKIRDNGTGIPPEVKEKMFNPFFTTKPAGEGTGLGLSISHDIIVKQHSGTIEVYTEPGAFTEFRIVLPRTGAPTIKSGERA